MKCLLILVVVVLAAVNALPGQNAPPPQLQPRPADPEPSRPLLLIGESPLKCGWPISLGAPIRGLQKEDFTLLDDKQPQSILFFHAFDSEAMPNNPLAQVILVVHAVNTSVTANSSERSQVRRFLLQNGDKPLPWPVSLVLFSSQGTKMQDVSSRDGNALAALYDQYQTGLRSTSLTNAGYWGALSVLICRSKRSAWS